MLLDGVVVGRVQYGRSDRAAEASLPDGSIGSQYVFHIHLPLPRAQAHRSCNCVVAVRTQDGTTHEQAFEFAIDPANSMPISVASGPTRSSSTYPHVRPSVVLYVERAALDDSGQLQVHGWAVSLTSLVTVQVFADEEQISAAQLGGQRDDVANAFPAYGNSRMSGFSLSTGTTMPVEGVSTIRVQALSLNGFAHEVVLPVERVRALMPVPQTEAPAPAAHLPQQPLQSSPMVQPQPMYTLATGFQFDPGLPSLLSSPMPSLPAISAPVRDPRREIRFYCDEMELDAEGHVSVTGWAVCAIGISVITIHLDERNPGRG